MTMGADVQSSSFRFLSHLYGAPRPQWGNHLYCRRPPPELGACTFSVISSVRQYMIGECFPMVRVSSRWEMRESLMDSTLEFGDWIYRLLKEHI